MHVLSENRGDVMKKRILSCAVVTAFTLSILHAGEFRAPVTTQSGPLRYDVYKKHDKWSFNMWSIGSYRSASRSFLKHGIKTNEFTSLLFGADEFKVAEAFSPGDAQALTQNFNANLNGTKMAPRATYSEQGMTLGGRFEYPLCDNTARIGVRASVPFKTVRVERDDTAETAAVGDQRNVVKNITGSIKVPNDNAGGADDVAVTTDMYRLSFVKDLPFQASTGMTRFVASDGTHMTVAGKKYDRKLTDDFKAFYGDIPFVLIANDDAKQIPFVEKFAVQLGAGTKQVSGNATDGAIVQLGKDFKAPDLDGTNLVTAPLSGGFEEGILYAFEADEGKKYQDLLDANKDIDNVWLLAINNNKGAILDQPAVGGLKGLIERYGQDSAEQWLYQNGYQFLTTQRMGLGDADIDLFYEHDFNADWRGQAVLGLRLPTGGDNNYANNAYETRCLLGNGNHFEIKLGANIGWATPLDWLNLRADASYSFALKGKEKRAAAFKGATIHGIGPQVEADVDWGYFVTRLDATMFHPRTDDLSTTWGYEFYYKTRDNVKFKKATVTNDDNSWFGQRWYNDGDELTDGTKVTATNAGFHNWDQTLDGKVAGKNTDRIAHRIRFESHWQAHKYMSLFVGGAFTFAGQNISRDADGHIGMNVRF